MTKMPTPTIVIDNLRKVRKGRPILTGLSMTAYPGRITGVVGENGAGKSSAFRILLGLDRPSAGRATINGQTYAQLPHPLTHIGAVLDGPGAHPNRSATNHLRWIAASQGLPANRVEEVLDLVGLTHAAHREVGSFSLGMSQRLALATAMIGDPAVYILDEPLNGLDPQAIRFVRNLLTGWADQGKTVIISSHLIGELAGVADDVVVIAHGRAIAQGTVEEIQGHHPSLEAAYFALTEQDGDAHHTQIWGEGV